MPNTTGEMLRFGLGLGLLVGSLSFPIEAATQDYEQIAGTFRYPTDYAHCQPEEYPLFSALEGAKSARSSCIQNGLSGDWVNLRSCGYPTAQSCAAIEDRVCEMEDTMRAAQERCRADVARHQEREAERQRIEEGQRDVELAQLREMELARNAADAALRRGNPGLAAAIAERYVNPNDPSRAPRRLRSDGGRLSNLLGVRTTPAMRLSAHLSRLSLGVYRDIATQSLGQLDTAASSAGAFNVDAAPDGTALSGRIVRSTQLGTAPDNVSMSAAMALAAAWQDGGAVGKIAVLAVLAAQVVAIFDDSPDTEPSLLEGPFAENIASLSLAAAQGRIDLADDFVDVYTTQADLAKESWQDRQSAQESFEIARPAEESSDIVEFPSSSSSGYPNEGACLRPIATRNSSNGDSLITWVNECQQGVYCQFIDPDGSISAGHNFPHRGYDFTYYFRYSSGSYDVNCRLLVP